MQLDKQDFEFVVDGQFNPAIHNPAWYKANGLLDGVSDIRAMSSQHSSRIKFSEVEIECGFSEWKATTNSVDDYEETVRLANKLFIDILPHTPLTGGKTIISHLFVDGDSLVAERVRTKMNSLLIAPGFNRGGMQWNRDVNHSGSETTSTFWLCDDDAHFHASHEYSFGLESRFNGSTGLPTVKDWLGNTNSIVDDSLLNSKKILSALELEE